MRPMIAASVCLALASCSAGADTAAAERQAAQFQRMYSARQFNAIHAAAAPEFREHAPKAKFLEFMESVHRKLGPVTGSKAQGWHVNYGTGGARITLNYATQFERGAGAETFVYEPSGKGPRLLGYNINSDALVLD